MNYKISESAVNQKVGDERVILDLDSGKYFGLDEIGSRALDLLTEHGQITAVVDKIAQEYDAPKAQIQSDIEDLVKNLLENNLLTYSD